MKPYSQDVRQRVLRAIDTAKIATTLAASVATIKRYLKQRREMEHVLPKSIPVNRYESSTYPGPSSDWLDFAAILVYAIN